MLYRITSWPRTWWGFLFPYTCHVVGHDTALAFAAWNREHGRVVKVENIIAADLPI